MNIELEVTAAVSRKGLFQAFDILREAALRLAPRMTESQLHRLKNLGADLVEAAEKSLRNRDTLQRSVTDCRNEFRDRPHSDSNGLLT